MFKNDFTTSQSYILSKKEKKDLFKKHHLRYDSKILDYINKNFETIYMYKTNLNKKRVLTYENNPIFFEYDNDLFYPTVYLLNMFPNLIANKKAIIYEETDSFLDNGADLMLKGVLNREDIKKNISFKLNDLFVVQTTSG